MLERAAPRSTRHSGLYVALAVAPHKFFTRAGDDLGRGLALHGLAQLLQAQGRYAEALPPVQESWWRNYLLGYVRGLGEPAGNA